MTRPRLLAVLALGLATSPALSRARQAQDAPRPEAPVPARFVRVEEPINDDTIRSARDGVLPFLAEMAARPAGPDGTRPVPVVVFEFVPGDKAPGRSPLGASSDLARFVSRDLDVSERTRVRTVAFVPKGLEGYAVLAALACDDIVMASGSSLGPITPESDTPDDDALTFVKNLAKKKRREPEAALFQGMVNKDLDVRRVKTADNQVHYVLSTDLEAFQKERAIVDDQPAWEAGSRGRLSADQARERKIVGPLAEDRGDLRRGYHLDSTADLVTSGGDSGELSLDGPVTAGVAGAALRYLSEQSRKGTARVFIRMRSAGGDVNAVNSICNALIGLKGVETIAYVESEALGISALIPLACDKIVFKQGALMGDSTRAVAGGGGAEDLNVKSIADTFAQTAAAKGHSSALARAMVDPKLVIVEARDNQTGQVVALIESDLVAGRHVRQGTVKGAGEVLKIRADAALSLGLATRVVRSDEELWSSYGLKAPPKAAKATWVDNLVTTLNTPWMSGLLLFVGLFMLILELKLPGVGLPAIISALAFLLFFWSHYLGGTADQLEILLFLVGVVCLALELFVFPGFAVFGLSGILLILASVIMASHTFVWPTREYEYRQMGQTLMEVTISIVTVSVGAVILGRYFPQMPLFRRMVLHPEAIGGSGLDGKPGSDGEATYFYLLGEVGRTTTALKPTGKARFGEALIDVSADGFYIEPGAAVEVVEVQGSKVIVKRA